MAIKKLVKNKDIFETDSCVRMLGFHAHSQRETKEVALQSQSEYIGVVPHINKAVLQIRPVCQDASLL